MNNSKKLAVTTQIGKLTTNPLMPVSVDDMVDPVILVGQRVANTEEVMVNKNAPKNT